MNNSECKKNKISYRIIGLVALSAGIFLFLAGTLTPTIFAVLFSIPLLALSIALIAAPERDVCGVFQQN